VLAFSGTLTGGYSKSKAFISWCIISGCMAQKFHKDVSEEENIFVREDNEIREVDVGNVDVYSVPVDEIYVEEPEEIEMGE